MKEKWKVWESFLKGEKHMRYLTVLFLTAALAGIASADILDTYVDSSPVPETTDMLYLSNGIGDQILAGELIQNLLHFEVDTDWLSAVLEVTPDAAGMIYQNADAGSMFPVPLPDMVYPCKEYDTWISDGSGVSPGAPSTAVAVDFGYSTKIFTEDQVALAFYTDLTEIGDLLLAQMSLSTSAQGTWQFSGTASPASDPDNGIYGPIMEILDIYAPGGALEGQGLYGVIEDGYMIIVPEPATMGLLLVGGLGVLIRRKR